MAKGNAEEIPHKSNSNCPRAQLRSSEFAHAPSHTHCALFLLINTLLVSPLPVFVGIPFGKAKGPGLLSLITSLVARIWRFRHHHPAQSLAGSPSPAPRCRSPRLSEIACNAVFLQHLPRRPATVCLSEALYGAFCTLYTQSLEQCLAERFSTCNVFLLTSPSSGALWL